jgi:putative SOS response-associated peptidase YedK
MCGRAKLETDVSEIKIAFRVPPEYPTPNFPPSWNVAPTDNLPIVRYDAKARPSGDHSPEGKAGHRTLDLMRWGLVPFWAKDIKNRVQHDQRDGRDRRYEAGLPRGIPAAALHHPGRCLLRMEEARAKERQPYAIALADRSLMALAGLWETWKSRANNETIRSFTIVTTS